MLKPSIKQSSEKPDNSPVGDTSYSTPEWIEALSKWNMEFAVLYRKRLQEWLMLPVSVAQCRSPDDLRTAQAKFTDTLMTDYRLAAQKLWNSVHEITDDTKMSATEAYAATLLKAQADAENILAQARARAQRIIESANAQSETSPAETQRARVA
jgi:hypothetical protein